MSDIEYPQIDITAKLNNDIPDRAYNVQGRESKIIKDGIYRPDALVELLVDEIEEVKQPEFKNTGEQ